MWRMFVKDVWQGCQEDCQHIRCVQASEETNEEPFGLTQMRRLTHKDDVKSYRGYVWHLGRLGNLGRSSIC